MILLAGTSPNTSPDWIKNIKVVGGLLLPAAFMLLILSPLFLALGFGLSQGGTESWTHILENRLVPYTLTTLGVLMMTAILILLLAVPAAWLITRTDFPGRGVFEWALILPLAMPGYVMAYAWGDLASVSGPLQSTLRSTFDISARDYWFPNIFTEAGLAFIFASTLFPYVYITARAAFVGQNQHLFDAARSLRAGHWRIFGQVGLPVAAPAILAGLTLALMEAAADYGAADFLGIPTLGVGIIRAWTSFGEPASAARLALVLMALAATLLLISQWLIGNRRATDSAHTVQAAARWSLSAGHSAIVISTLSLLLFISFIVPVGRLLWLLGEHGLPSRTFWPPLRSTVILGVAGAALALAAALIVALTRRGRTGFRVSLLAGYAAPGAVLGLGALMLLRATNVPLTGAVALSLLGLVYACRFSYAGLEPLWHRQNQVSARLGQVARSLGSSGIDKIWRVDLPILRPGLLAASLILFVEILKELPATLMLRPFGWDTLAVRAHAYATDERLAEATLPSLLIVGAGLLPVILISSRFAPAAQRNTA